MAQRRMSSIKSTLPSNLTQMKVRSDRDGPVRKKLEGQCLRQKQKRIKHRHQMSSILNDELEYNEESGISDFEDMVYEMSLEGEYTSDCPENQYITHLSGFNRAAECSPPRSLDSSLDESSSLWSTGSEDSGIGASSRSDFVDSSSSSHNSLDMGNEDLTSFHDQILVSVLQPDLPDLFTNSTVSTATCNTAFGIRKYAHNLGDIHTVFCAIMAWMTAKEKPDILLWCKVNGINPKTLKLLMWKLRSFRECRQVLDIDLAIHHIGLKRLICERYKYNLYYYLGHPAVGYKSLSSGHIIKCCPSSSTHHTDNFSLFAICLPRHQHKGMSVTCHYVIPLTQEEIDDIGLENFPDFDVSKYEAFRVSEINEQFLLTENQSQALSKLVDEHPRADVEDLPLHVDISEPHNVKVFAPPHQHDSVRQLVKDIIRDKLANAVGRIKEYKFPPNNSGFRVRLTDGVHCDDILLPSDNSKLVAGTEGEDRPLVDIQTPVNVNLQLRTTQWHCAALDDHYLPNKCRRHMNKTLYEVNTKHWTIAELTQSGDVCNITVHFYDRLTAKRALYFIKEDPNILVLDEDGISRQLLRCEIVISSAIFTAIGDMLMERLKRFERSPKIKAESRLIGNRDSSVVIEVCTKDSASLSSVVGILDTLTKPTELPLRKPADMRQRLIGSQGANVMQLVGGMTGTYICLTPESDALKFFGDLSARKDAMKKVELYLECYFSRKWKRLGKLDIEYDANDVLTHICNQEGCLAKYSTDDDIFINVQTNELWILSTPEGVEAAPERLKQKVVDYLEITYKTEVALSNVNFISTQKTFECVACYCEFEEQSYIVHSCGHQYCYECLSTQINTVISENRVPICCAECNTPFSVGDFDSLRYLFGVHKQKRLIKSGLADFLTKHSDTYRFCPKPNCDGVFKKCAKAEGGLVCGVCSSEICPDCYERQHDGVTCAQYMEVGKWLEGDKKFRKICPNCSMAIEKNGGCMNVHCAQCKISICWVCLSYFSKSSDCYAHMDQKKHWNY